MQLANAPYLIVVKCSLKITCVNSVHFQNAYFPIVVKFLLNSTEVNSVQNSNA